MRVIVTGAQGQDGSILVSELLRQGHEVTAVGRRRLDDFSSRDNELIQIQESNPLFSYQI